MVRNGYGGFGDQYRGGRGGGGFGRRGSGRGAPQGAKRNFSIYSNQSQGPAGQQQQPQPQPQPQQQGQPAPKKRAPPTGSRQEAEENFEYWGDKGTEAVEKRAEWQMKRDALPVVPEAKVELDKEVEKAVARAAADKAEKEEDEKKEDEKKEDEKKEDEKKDEQK
ncbi:hypothetical protein CEP53_000984 [Fusarium sp. AF-6]|nr:hypothetical protein CEP53_000984 [Fusarium sp. AF-6]